MDDDEYMYLKKLLDEYSIFDVLNALHDVEVDRARKFRLEKSPILAKYHSKTADEISACVERILNLGRMVFGR